MFGFLRNSFFLSEKTVSFVNNISVSYTHLTLPTIA